MAVPVAAEHNILVSLIKGMGGGGVVPRLLLLSEDSSGRQTEYPLLLRVEVSVLGIYPGPHMDLAKCSLKLRSEHRSTF